MYNIVEVRYQRTQLEWQRKDRFFNTIDSIDILGRQQWEIVTKCRI